MQGCTRVELEAKVQINIHVGGIHGIPMMVKLVLDNDRAALQRG